MRFHTNGGARANQQERDKKFTDGIDGDEINASTYFKSVRKPKVQPKEKMRNVRVQELNDSSSIPVSSTKRVRWTDEQDAQVADGRQSPEAPETEAELEESDVGGENACLVARQPGTRLAPSKFLKTA